MPTPALIPLSADTYMAIDSYPTSDFLHNLLLAGSSASDFSVVGIGGSLSPAPASVRGSRFVSCVPTHPYQELNYGRTSKGKAENTGLIDRASNGKLGNSCCSVYIRPISNTTQFVRSKSVLYQNTSNFCDL